MDVETTAEALQEEEELIEAVETFVETAAVSIWSEIVKEIESAWNKLLSIMETLFPVLIDYQNDESLFWADLEKFLLSALLFAITFFLLAPRSTNTNNNKRRKKWMFGLHSRSDSKETIHVTSPTGASSPPREGSMDDSLPRPSNSPVSAATLCMGRILSEDETDEERFEKLWVTISKTAYRRLVLPPECRLVEKSRHPLAGTKKKEDDDKKRNDLENEEDHPAKRLQMYWRHVFFFIKSLLSYDYVSAGWTLLQWFQACLRSRKGKRQEDDEEDDDEASRNSTSTANTAPRRTSHNNSNWQQSTATLGKRGSFDASSTLPKIPLSDRDDEEEVGLDEEKKDEKVILPRKRAHSAPKETSMYFDSEGDDFGEADVGERVNSPRLAQKQKTQHHLQPLTPPLQRQRSAGGKRKDALEVS